MRLASLRAGGRDGSLLVVASDGQRATAARAVTPSLQAALDDWERAAPALEALAREVEAGAEPTFELDFDALGPPLPRAYEWIDGSAYLEHIRLVRRARGAAPPPTLESDPLVYQGGSGVLHTPPWFQIVRM